MGRQADDDAASAHDNFRCPFDEERSPGTRLSLGQRIALPTTLIMTPTLGIVQRLRRNFGHRFRRRRQGHRLAKAHEQVERGSVQIEPKEVAHEAVIAGAVDLQTALEFLVAILAFAALGVVVIGGAGNDVAAPRRRR
jgi:hypothetical protein